MKRFILAVSVVFCLCLFAAAARADVLPRLKFKAGDKAVYDMMIDISDTVEQSGDIVFPLPHPFTVSATGTMTIEVLKVNEFDVTTLKLSSPDAHVLVDGKEMSDAAPGSTGADVAAMLVNGLEIDLDNESHILELRFARQAPGIDVEILRNLLITPALELPKDPVAPGKPWNRFVMPNLPFLADSAVVNLDGDVKLVKSDTGAKLVNVSSVASYKEDNLKVTFEEVKIPSVDTSNLTMVINAIEAKMKTYRTLDLDKGSMSAMTINVTGTVDAYGETSDGSKNITIAGDITATLKLSPAASK